MNARYFTSRIFVMTALGGTAGLAGYTFTPAQSWAWTVYTEGLLTSSDITGEKTENPTAFRNSFELERPSLGERLEFNIVPGRFDAAPQPFEGIRGGVSDNGPVRYDVLRRPYADSHLGQSGPGPVGFIDPTDPPNRRAGLGITFETRYRRPRAYAGYGERDYILKMYLDPNISPTGPVRTLGAEFSPFRRKPDVKLRIIGGTDYSRGGGGPGGSVGVEFGF